MSILKTKVRPKSKDYFKEKTLLHIDFEATNKHKNVKYLALTSQGQLNSGSKEFIGWLSPPPLEVTQGKAHKVNFIIILNIHKAPLEQP